MSITNIKSSSAIPIISAFIYKNETTSNLSSIMSYDDGSIKNIWPPSIISCKFNSSQDISNRQQIPENETYSYPIYTVSSDTLDLNVSVFPSLCKWKIQTNYSEDETDETFHETEYIGDQIIEIPFYSRIIVGSKLYTYNILSMSNKILGTFKFWIITKEAGQSTLSAISDVDWSFSNRDLIDKRQNIELIPSITGNMHYSDLVAINDYSLETYTTTELPNSESTYISLSSAISGITAISGLTLEFFTDSMLLWKVGFMDTVLGNWSGNNFSIECKWGQIYSHGFYRMDYTYPESSRFPAYPNGDGAHDWHHYALTFKLITDISTLSGITISEDGLSGTYISPNVNYSSNIDLSTYSAYQIAGNRVGLFSLYVNGKCISELLYTYNGLSDSLVDFRDFFINYTNSTNAGNIHFDDIKIFKSCLTASDIIEEAVAGGIDIDNTSTQVEEKDTYVRLRSGVPDDFTTVPLTGYLKPFIIDNQTIAIACDFYDFWVDRLLIEWPITLPNEEYNYKFVSPGSWTRDMKYKFCYIDLLSTYVPLIQEKFESADYWKVNNNNVELLGNWQNANQDFQLADLWDGTDFVECSQANIIFFAYLKLSEPMIDGNTITISNGDNNSVDLTYSSNHYCSSIKVNQEGYSPVADKKYAYVGMWMGTAGTWEHDLNNTNFYIKSSTTNEIVYTGEISQRSSENDDYTSTGGVTFKETGENVFELDFSDFNIDGEYQIYIPNVGYSHKFKIGNQVMINQFFTHMKGMFHQRSGIAKVPPYTNWEYPYKDHYFTYKAKFISNNKDYYNCVDKYGNEFPGNTFSMINSTQTSNVIRNLRGGWDDAADFDRRPYHALCVQDMLDAYLLCPDNFYHGQLNIPEMEENNLPDILNEAIWGLKIWKDEQQQNGGISMWIESTGHASDWPWLSKQKYFQSEPNRKDSLVYAKLVAKLYKALKIYYKKVTSNLDKKYITLLSQEYLNSATMAFNFGITLKNNCEFSFTYSSDSTTYTYNESIDEVNNQVFTSAIALFSATKDNYYCKFINDTSFNNWYNVIKDLYTYEIISSDLLMELKEFYPVYWKKSYDLLANLANTFKTYQNSNIYRNINWPKNHSYYNYNAWGSCHPETRGRYFIYMWKITGDTSWRDQAFLSLDWALGCNPMGRSLTSGLGKVYPVNFLHHWLPRARVEWNKYEGPIGISPYTFINSCGTAIPYVFMISSSGRYDLLADAINMNILPGSAKNTVQADGGKEAVYLQTIWPIWRWYNEVGGQTVSSSEFTISETISGKAFITGCLLNGIVGDADQKNKEPATDRYGVEGYIFLP